MINSILLLQKNNHRNKKKMLVTSITTFGKKGMTTRGGDRTHDRAVALLRRFEHREVVRFQRVKLTF